MTVWNNHNNKASEALHRVMAVSWYSLRPAIAHAIVLALEAEALSRKRSLELMQEIAPAYPPLVEMLAEAAPLPAINRTDGL